MSQENVELVRAGIEALNRRDLEGAIAPFAEALEFEDVGTGISSSGRSAMAQWIAEFLDSYSEYTETPEDIVDLGEQIVMHMRTDATGKGSGAPVSTHHAEVHTFGSDGLVTALTVYPTYEAALAAVGLNEAEGSESRA
jgi:ketosteroid isomerase-like protein